MPRLLEKLRVGSFSWNVESVLTSQPWGSSEPVRNIRGLANSASPPEYGGQMELGELSERARMDALPSGWQSYTIGQTLTLINGLAFKPSEWKAHGTPIVRIQNLNDDDSSYNYCDDPISDKYHIRAGDILFAWSGTTGTSFGARIWTGPNAVLNQHIFKVVPDKTKLTPYYSFLVLQNVQKEIERRAHGFKSSFVHVKKSDLTRVPLT